MSFQAGSGILTENSKNDTQIIAIFCVTMGKIGIFCLKIDDLTQKSAFSCATM